MKLDAIVEDGKPILYLLPSKPSFWKWLLWEIIKVGFYGVMGWAIINQLVYNWIGCF